MKSHKDIIFIFSSLLVITIAWIIFSIRHNALTSTISEPLNQEITAITPDFNTKVIDQLKKRTLVDPIYQFPNGITISTTETQATEAATPTPSEIPQTLTPTEQPAIDTPTEIPTITNVP